MHARIIARTLRLPIHVVLPDSPVVLTKVDAWTAEGEAYAIATGSDLSAFISTQTYLGRSHMMHPILCSIRRSAGIRIPLITRRLTG